jgi:hypothetical protein
MDVKLGLSPEGDDTHKFKVFKNRVLRRISGSVREEVAGGWIKLHRQKLYNV